MNNVRNGRLQQFAFYGLVVIVGMLSWFMSTLYQDVARIKEIQAERKTRVESISILQGQVNDLAVKIAVIFTTDATLKRHEDMLRRLEEQVFGRRGPTPPVPF